MFKLFYSEIATEYFPLNIFKNLKITKSNSTVSTISFCKTVVYT